MVRASTRGFGAGSVETGAEPCGSAQGGSAVKAVRASLIVVILLNLALLATSGPLRATLSRYELARKQAELRKLAVENRALLGGAAQARRPDRVAARAAAMGIDLHLIENEAMAGPSPAEKKPVPIAPRP